MYKTTLLCTDASGSTNFSNLGDESVSEMLKGIFTSIHMHDNQATLPEAFTEQLSETNGYHETNKTHLSNSINEER